jgi:antitoxin (DNA-binding transcriptional repressor) of toxin-antitoxin stability system
MLRLHMSEVEIAGNFAAALEKVRQGIEVVVEHEHEPVAVLKGVEPARRTISEILALMPKDSTAVMDESFARDVEDAIEAHREPLDISGWDWFSTPRS